MSVFLGTTVPMFRMPGFPWIVDELQQLAEKAGRVLDDADADRAELAVELADVVDVFSQQLRDYAAEQLVGRSESEVEAFYNNTGSEKR